MGTYSMGLPHKNKELFFKKKHFLGNIHIPYIVDIPVKRLAMA
jgi:hypothetical protein